VLDIHESGSPKGGKQPRTPNIPPDYRASEQENKQEDCDKDDEGKPDP
jgi:hypothetical protein